ncbi:MAG: hypothetical protein HY238_10940 [Acidobacteria bacterium]|nr:hypothetical protein [Acidobacteriota bacterium]
MPRAGANLEQKQRWMREQHGERSVQSLSPIVSVTERHYTVAEIASMWNLAPDTVRRIFEREPGVLMLGETNGGKGKRRYTTIRIPESVAQRVYRRRLVVGA